MLSLCAPPVTLQIVIGFAGSAGSLLKGPQSNVAFLFNPLYEVWLESEETLIFFKGQQVKNIRIFNGCTMTANS